MVTCSCGRKIDKIPNWMQGINVNFVCNNCPNRNIKNIASVSLEIDAENARKHEAENLAKELALEETLS